ncbi:uncharacterized protein MONOS_3381 [Monocercomonoides exilis]|uniref:uncharacterized protein n=1 Tax=Monocercomonoides exilis TaxID=2049356 RepID=UPI0035594E24|nr:hypothetical protein MONOS_3381 [Monocercomonoides exilis]|eukprot:MONOS_3381.1-p1 / transcript=MONOS_3381.1 / gene=MONOS_3381 / organism=Monocercomonoides_exilis_PA203 / gene_product=unspecified product / transcript_product=unspecified product / location=Mono_scaffold00079:58541-58946(+) / protein_length=80 / sequence_SO=supercontig / SO=protein_coding / is_pseudo=false
MDGLSPEEIGYIFMGRTVLDCTPLFKLNARIGSTFCSVLKRTFIPAKIPAPFKLKKSEMEAAEVYERKIVLAIAFIRIF